MRYRHRLWWVLVVFAPEAILDTLARLDNISGLILGAVIESHLRVTSSRMNMEVGNYLEWFVSSIHAAQGLLGLHLSTRVCPTLTSLAPCLSGSSCIMRLFRCALLAFVCSHMYHNVSS